MKWFKRKHKFALEVYYKGKLVEASHTATVSTDLDKTVITIPNIVAQFEQVIAQQASNDD